MKNFLLTIEYDGTNFHGWQRQPEDPTIQQAVEDALFTMTRQRVTLTGSGRTDAGVHALGQTANFRCDTRLSPDEIRKGLCSLLPRDITVHQCEEVPPDFHARFDVIKKTYHYHILNRTTPPAVGRRYVWHIRKALDLDAMRKSLSHFAGERDFAAFEGKGGERASTVRTVFEAVLETPRPDLLVLCITANGFLRFMVRNITGTVVEAGLGRFSPDEVKRILETGDRTAAGQTAPPQGLFLMNVEYPGRSAEGPAGRDARLPGLS